MKGFLGREWELFLQDMRDFGEMFMAPFEEEPIKMLASAKVQNDTYQKTDGFWKTEWNAFLQDMQNLGEMVMSAFEKEPTLMLNSAAKEEKKVGFVKNEWNLFKQDIEQANQTISNVFGGVSKQNEVAEPAYIKDEIDYKVETYLGENIDELKENACGTQTQHETLREYANFFKPYADQPEMCQTAFKKYYDRHALKMAISEFPVEQVRIIQNNADLFIKGQEIFGEGGQFIDSRVDGIFDKVGMSEVNKLIGILSDNVIDGRNLQGERLFAEAVSYMVDNGIKLDKSNNLLLPIKKSLESKLDNVHSSLKSHDDWNEEYQTLLSQERKYLYALNRIEQYETEQRISEFESKLNDLDVIV